MMKELRSQGQTGNPDVSHNREARATPMSAGFDGKGSVTRTKEVRLPLGSWTHCGDAPTAMENSGRRKRRRKIT